MYVIYCIYILYYLQIMLYTNKKTLNKCKLCLSRVHCYLYDRSSKYTYKGNFMFRNPKKIFFNLIFLKVDLKKKNLGTPEHKNHTV